MKTFFKFHKFDAETWMAKYYRLLRQFCGHIRAFATDRSVRAAHTARVLEWFLENWLALAISIALATAVYFGIHEKRALEFDRNIAVRVRRVPEGHRVVADPLEIKVTFRGSREDMNAIEMSPPTIVVPYPTKLGTLTNAVSQKITRRNVEMSGLRGSGAATVVRLATSEIKLKEDVKTTLDFKIEPPVVKGIPFGGRIAEIEGYEPKTVQVTSGGGKLDVWELNGKQPRLGEISVDGRADDFTVTAPILPPRDDDGIDIQMVPATATVKVKMTMLRNKKSLEEIPVRLALRHGVFVPQGTEISPTNVNVTLVGPTNTTDAISATNIAVYAEVDALPDVFTNAIKVALSVRVPHDRSITTTTLDPPSIFLIPPPPPEEPEESEEAPEKPETASDSTPATTTGGPGSVPAAGLPRSIPAPGAPAEKDPVPSGDTPAQEKTESNH